MAKKVTFTFDRETVENLNRTAAKQRKPKSQAVREAIRELARHPVRLSQEEVESRRRVLAEISQNPRPRPEVEAELAAVRRARRHGGRLHPAPAYGP